MNKLKNPLVIVANGDFPTHLIPLNILNNASSIIACDGATDILLSKNYKPDLIVGDFDSISKVSKKKYSERLIYIKDQSENDLRKAINYAIKYNIDDITIIGASGQREDHTIGNIFSILNYKKIKIKLLTDYGIFSCIHKSKKIKSFKGQSISFFTSDNSITISSNHLKYNFNDNNINNLYLGSLNECLYDYFDIKISHGNLLIFQSYK